MTAVIIESWNVQGLDWSIAASGNPRRIHFAEAVYNDAKEYERAARLGRCERGSGHDCYLKGIDVRANMYTTQNIHRHLLRYKFVDIVSSMSLENNWREIIESDFHMQNVDPVFRDILRNRMEVCGDRNYFLHNMPMGVLLGISFKCNYLQLKTIHAQRRTHRNPGWQIICDWIEELPMFKEIVLDKEKG